MTYSRTTPIARASIAVISVAFAFVHPSSAQQTMMNPSNPGSVNSPVTGPGSFSNLAPLSPTGNEGAVLLNQTVSPMQPEPNPAINSGMTPQLGANADATMVEASDGKTTTTETETKRWRLRPLFSFGVTYDDNIFISNTNRQGDVIFSLTAGLAFEIGDYRNLQENYLIAEYMATGFLYADHTSQDAVNQNAAIRGQYRFGKLTVQGESTYQYLTGSERDVGNFANRNLFYNALRFLYDYSDKTQADLEFQQRTFVYENYNNSYEEIIKGGVDYLFTGKIALGLEGRLGFLDVEGSPFQIYEQARLRARYDATGKVAIKLSGGVELREYAGGEAMKATPVFSAGVEYRPFTNTLLSLNAYRDVNPSASVTGQDIIATGVAASVQQLVFQRVTLGFTAGYENDDYIANVSDTDADREDNYFFIRPSLSVTILGWLNTGVFYEFRRNDSNQEDNSFYNNRVGADITAQF